MEEMILVLTNAHRDLLFQRQCKKYAWLIKTNVPLMGTPAVFHEEVENETVENLQIFKESVLSLSRGN